MNYSSNDISRMLHMHSETTSLQDYSKISVYHQDSSSTAADPLCDLMQNMAVHGEAITKIAEDTIELLQEEFVQHVQKKLQAHKITLQDKLNISLSASNTLIIQCNDDNENILAALGEDEKLVNLFIQLQRYAYIISGLQMLQAGTQTAGSSLVSARYNMCLKGSLSHFYLK